MDRFPIRMTFANAVLEAIAKATPKVIIIYWSCSKEKHIDGSPHYHFAVNFKDADPCPRCFAELVMSGGGNE